MGSTNGPRPVPDDGHLVARLDLFVFDTANGELAVAQIGGDRWSADVVFPA